MPSPPDIERGSSLKSFNDCCLAARGLQVNTTVKMPDTKLKAAVAGFMSGGMSLPWLTLAFIRPLLPPGVKGRHFMMWSTGPMWGTHPMDYFALLSYAGLWGALLGAVTGISLFLLRQHQFKQAKHLCFISGTCLTAILVWWSLAGFGVINSQYAVNEWLVFNRLTHVLPLVWACLLLVTSLRLSAKRIQRH